MPGQRRTGRPRTRGSWLPILAGVGAIVVLAGAGTAAYLTEFRPAGQVHGAARPQRVLGYQTVGLIGEAPAAASASGLVQLLSSRAVAGFSPVQPSETVSGTPEWTADQMTGGAYIFIYLPTGQCLTSGGRPGRPDLALRHCALTSAAQRWQRLGPAVAASGHDFYEFSNAATGRCITQLSSAAGRAGLTPCDPARPAPQLLAFWWSAS
jgi:hypothetical protein